MLYIYTFLPTCNHYLKGDKSPPFPSLPPSTPPHPLPHLFYYVHVYMDGGLELNKLFHFLVCMLWSCGDHMLHSDRADKLHSKHQFVVLHISILGVLGITSC